MKVSLNTIRQYLDFELPPVSELVSRINQQLGQIEEVIDLAPKYKDVLIVKVVSSEKHPDADRLSVCMVDDGGAVKEVERDEHGYVQVVCGAPNAREGIFAAWLPPKSTVPASFDDVEPFVLETREIRGVKSNGMLAAADELALGTDHDGIIEINPEEWKPGDVAIKPGASFAEAYGLNDTVLDIENKMFTHRPDLFGQIGVAREIAGIFHHQFSDPEWYWRCSEPVSGEGIELTVFNEAGEKVPRFIAVAMKNVDIKPSPLWLQIELVRLGSKAINNIVDATNYVMLLTGQPTHAYDYDKLRGTTLGVRMAKSGEKTTLLNDKSYELTEDDIVIVDGEGIVGLGGVMGGDNSEVSETTKNIVLEVATFDMYTIRKTSMRHGLFTDAVTRFNKGQSPLQNDRVMQLLVTSIQDISTAEVASSTFDLHAPNDIYTNQSISGTMKLEPAFINERLGVDLPEKDIEQLLRNVHFACFVDEGDTAISITAPFWRTDIELPEDIVEEVGRLYDFDKLPRQLPRRSIMPAPKNEIFELKKQLREKLRRAGVNEVLTYSFVHERTLKAAGQEPKEAYQLSNALSPDLQYYRLSLTPSLLEKVHPNIKSGHDEFALFELGKAHRVGDVDDEGLPREYKRLAFVWAAKKSTETGYFVAKRYFELLAPDAKFVPLSDHDVTKHPVFGQLAKPFEPKRSAVILHGDDFVGVVGEYKASVRSAFKLPDTTAGFEVFQSYLMNIEPRKYTPLSRFPKVTQDISLKVANDVSYVSVFELANKAVEATQPGNCDSSLEPLSIYQSEDDAAHKTITLRLAIASYEKTLTDKDVAAIMDAIAAETAGQLQAERI